MTRPEATQIATIAASRTAAIGGVVRLDAGPLGTKSTYGRGGKIDGVTVKIAAIPISVTVHVAVRFGRRIPELAEAITEEVRFGLDHDLPDAGPWDISIDVVDVVADDDQRNPAATEQEVEAGADPSRRKLL